MGEERKTEKTSERAERRRRAQTALLAVALGFAPFAACSQTESSKDEDGPNGKFVVVGPADGDTAEDAPSKKTPTTKTAAQSGYKAFLVGADDYDDAPKLVCVKNDVEAFAERLIEIGVAEENVTVLKSGGRRRDEPTKANIENRFAEFVASLKPGDFAVVFMSGHGLQAGEAGAKEAFFAPLDLDPEDLFGSSVSIDKMLERLDKSRAKSRWMIVDACREAPDAWSQATDVRTRSLGGAKGLTSPIDAPESTALLQSCQAGEVSYEAGEHGFFTLSLLEALDKNGSKADKDNDGVLSFTELIAYVTERTDALARENGGASQRPSFSGEMTDFPVLNTRIEGLAPQRWREANALYEEAAARETEGKFREALDKIREAREINSVNEDYKNLENRVANALKLIDAAALKAQEEASQAEAELKKQLEAERKAREEAEKAAAQAEAERKAKEEAAQAEAAALAAAEKAEAERKAKEKAEAEKAAEDAWKAFELGGEANVEKAIELMKESLKLVDAGSNRSALKTFEEELEALRNPVPQPTPPEPTSVAWTDAPAAGTQKSLEIKGATYNFRYCPAGTFTMGSPEGESGHWSGETQHEVTLTRGFWMLETEVTQALWESVTGENPMTSSYLKGPKKPVGNVSWDDCQKFIEKLNSLGIAPAGLKFRLPTEAEWEYACRAGTSGPYAGSSLDSMGWYGDNSGYNNHEVGKKAPNAWGLYDMHGNVWEWCSDWFASDTYDAPSQTDPTGPSSGSPRVLRGGGWDYGAKNCRSADRGADDPTHRDNRIGFRLVLGREIETSSAESVATPSAPTVLPSPSSAGSPSGSASSTGTSAASSSASSDWTEAHTAGTQKSLNIKGAPYNFRYCPAGTFMMGSPESEPERLSYEQQHEVTLTRGFWMLETEVTQALWESVTGENPMTADSLKGPRKPVGNVSWEDCQEFIAKLNSLGIAPAGLKFRLPTEAEWEYACRAGTSGPYAGSSLDTMGWYGNNSGGDNYEVGKKAPNAWGLYDMHGNVWEWCSDWFDFATYDAASQTDPTGPSSGSLRVLRGGGWFNVARRCRSAYRSHIVPTRRYNDNGFRLVLGR